MDIFNNISNYSAQYIRQLPLAECVCVCPLYMYPDPMRLVCLYHSLLPWPPLPLTHPTILDDNSQAAVKWVIWEIKGHISESINTTWSCSTCRPKEKSSSDSNGTQKCTVSFTKFLLQAAFGYTVSSETMKCMHLMMPIHSIPLARLGVKTWSLKPAPNTTSLWTKQANN